MYALFRLEIAIGIFAVTFKRYGFNACFIAVKKIQLLNCEARPLAIAYVHAVEHAYPVLSLRSSCACMQRKHCVCAVIGAAQQSCDTEFLDRFLERAQLLLRFERKLLVILFLIPESPRWLITQNKDGRAAVIFSKIYIRKEDVEKQVADTKSTIAGEQKSEWKQLLSPGILKAVVIGVCIAILGQFMGVNAVLYYGPSMFKDAGMSDPLFCQVLVG